jgi:heat shock protein HslJ
MAAIMLGSGLVGGLAGCGDAPSTGDWGASSTTDADAVDAGWQLTDGTTAAGPLPLIEEWPITLTVHSDMFTGVSACNRYGASLTRDGDSVHVDGVGGTEMGCEPPVMALESAFLEALSGVDRISRDGATLTLTGPDVELHFAEVAPTPTAELIGTRWVLETLLDGDLASSTVGEQAVLVLGDDGSLTGSTGCRRLNGRYVESGDEIRVDDLAASGTCPPEVEAQDAHVMAVLGDAFEATVEGDVLTLATPGGPGLVFRVSQS